MRSHKGPLIYNKVMKKIIIILTILLIVCGCSNKKEEVVVEEEPIIEEAIIEEPVTTVTSATLIMGGDALTHESVYLDNQTSDGYDFTYPFEELKKIVEPYDLAYYNQETVLGGKEYGVSGYPVFNTPQEVGESLIDAGFNLISLATNHILDYYSTYGNQLMLSQLNFFKKYPDVYTAGSYLSGEERSNIKIGEVNDITYALLSYTYGSNSYGPNANEDYLVNYIDKDLIRQDVDYIRDKVDVLLVAMHWGEEGALEENNYQKEYAKFLADLDVDIVIGTHPHVLQPIEWIDDTLVIYSLGNMYSNQYFNIDNLSSCLTSVNITKTQTGEDVDIEIKDVTCDLIFTVLNDRHKVYLYRDLTDEQLNSHETYFNKYKDILTKYESDIVVR